MNTTKPNGTDHDVEIMNIGLMAGHDDECGCLVVPPSETMRTWPHVREYIRSAQITNGEAFSDLDCLKDLASGRVLLWLIYQGRTVIGACTTQLRRGGDGLFCQIMTIGGAGMHRWLDLIKHVEAYAQAEGCVRMRIEGRIGWERMLPDYHRTGVIIEKGL